MKRIISLLLCVIMCISVFTATAGQVLAVGDASAIFTVTNTEFVNNEITYTIKVAAGQKKITGAIVNVTFDNNLFEVVGEKTGVAESFSGMCEHGLVYGSDNVYAFAYMNMNGYSVNSVAKDMFTITFRGKLGDERPVVRFDFDCVEFITDDDNAENDINKRDGVQNITSHSVSTLEKPVVKAVRLSDGVEISFKAVVGAEKYIIEKKTGNGSFQRLAEIVANGDVKYLDKNISVGSTYTYRVRSLANGYESGNAVTAAITILNSTKITSCYNEVNGVQLKWNAVSGATSYKVYRKLPSQTTWTAITTTSTLAYQDTNVVGDTIYQYVVTAVDQYGNESAYSAQRECRFIETPTLLSRTNAVGGVTITWEKVAGATSYRIYRRGAGTDYWFYLGDFPATLDTFTDYETANYFPENPSKNEQAKPKSGNYYRYTVRASYDGKDSSGKDYLIYSGFDTNGLYLKYVATPKLTSISNATNGLQIKWNAVNGGGDIEYRVYRRGAGSTYWKYLGTTLDTTWTDAEVKNANGGYYRYTVRAVAGKNGNGWYSAFDTTGLFLMRLANPTLKSATSSSTGITVKWSSIKGATYYNVYRKTANSGWTRIAVVSGNTNTTYLDKTAKKGTTYTYTVRAGNGKVTSYFNSGISCKDLY